MVENKTTVLILVLNEIFQTSIPPLISALYAKGYHDFPLKRFCLTVPETFVDELFCASKNFWYRKLLVLREGGYQGFPPRTFCLTVPNVFAGEPFSVSFISGIEKC